MSLPDHLTLEIVTPESSVVSEQVDEVQIPGAEGSVGVLPDRVTILAQIAESADKIDVTRAQTAEKRAKDRLARPTQDVDVERARLAMLKSLVRLRVASKTRTRG